MGGQISWLIPGALIGLLAVLWLTRRAPRTDRVRAAFLIFGGWLLLTGAVFSFAQGIIHPYYTVALAPAIGALVGMGACTLWSRRREVFPRLALSAAILATLAWAFVILGWSPDVGPGVALGDPRRRRGGRRGHRPGARARGCWPLGSPVSGWPRSSPAPAAYSLQTAGTAHSGAIPSAGPAVQTGGGFGGGGPGGFGAGPGGGGPVDWPVAA